MEEIIQSEAETSAIDPDAEAVAFAKTDLPQEEADLTATAEDTAAARTAEADMGEAEVDYARLAAEDLAEIKRLDPAYAPAAHLSELPFARRYAELRDMGLSVAEALAAAAPRFQRIDGRAHLRSMAPRAKGATEGTLDHARMKEAKLLFHGLTEAEINALYRRVSRTNND